MCHNYNSHVPIAPIGGAAVDTEDIVLKSADGTDFAAMVARRRGVTYPLAFSKDCREPASALAAAATSTIGFWLRNLRYSNSQRLEPACPVQLPSKL